MQNDPKKFVSSRKGNIPVVLTAPHGASPLYSSSLFIERPAHKNVVKKGDLKTSDLLHAIDSKLGAMGFKPYFVTLRVHRKFIDANRNILNDDQVAVHKDCELSKQVYKYYHEQIEDMVGEAAGNSIDGRILLLDIHGMAPYADYIVCGTKNKTTCDADFIERDYTGFLYHLRKLCGATVLPAREAAVDVAKYSGGYTVQRHGGGRIDAIQLEFGAFLRKQNQIDAAASVVASSVENTLNSMQGFLMDLGRWNLNIHAVEKVKTKLRRIHCFTPQDLRARLQREKGNNINASLRFVGERPFRKDTLEEFAMKLGVGAAPSTRAEGEETRVGLVQGESPISLVRRIFVPEGDHTAVQWMGELLASTPRPSDDASTSSGDAIAEEGTTATSADTVFASWDCTGKTGDLVLDAGRLRRLGPSGESIDEGEGEPDAEGDKCKKGTQGTSITFPSHEAFRAALSSLEKRLGGSVSLESVDVEPSSTHCLAFVVAK